MPTANNGGPHSTEPPLEKPPPAKELRVVGLLGSGQFASVWRVDGGAGSSTEFALKKCCKRTAAQEQKGIDHLLEEKQVHASLDHPTIVRLFDTFQDDESCYFLLELCGGGDLGMLLDATTKQSEAHASFYGGCVTLALRHLHAQGWIQRDLKPDNVLLDGRGYAKLADFGYAARLEGDEARKYTMCGTDEYAPPEMLRHQGRSFPSDWWALGVLLHHLILGQTPFDAADEDEAFDNIMEYAHGDPRKRQEGQDQLRSEMVAGGVGEEGCALILALLNASERKRLGSGPACDGPPLEEHAWWRGALPGFDWDALLHRKLSPPALPWAGRADAHARNCFGEYKSAPIAAERAVTKWREVPAYAAPVPARDQHLFLSFGPTVSVPPPVEDVWRERNERSSQ
eukprot:Transcript_30380.p1 GENE.Transcript_30380~~Transcript_30380.p1  ORF type:complete len:421 (-),score=152.94 Transcript_30380:294-1490(-)